MGFQSFINETAAGFSAGQAVYWVALTGMKICLGPIGWAGPAYYVFGQTYLYASAAAGAGAFGTLGGGIAGVNNIAKTINKKRA